MLYYRTELTAYFSNKNMAASNQLLEDLTSKSFTLDTKTATVLEMTHNTYESDEHLVDAFAHEIAEYGKSYSDHGTVEIYREEDSIKTIKW